MRMLQVLLLLLLGRLLQLPDLPPLLQELLLQLPDLRQPLQGLQQLLQDLQRLLQGLQQLLQGLQPLLQGLPQPVLPLLELQLQPRDLQQLQPAPPHLEERLNHGPRDSRRIGFFRPA